MVLPARASNWESDSYFDYVGTSSINTTVLSALGINAYISNYSTSKNFEIKKQMNIVYDTYNGTKSKVCELCTCVYVFPNGNTYDVWTWAEVCPYTVTAKNLLGIKTVYDVIPDDLTIHSYLPSSAVYVSSTPKNQIPQTTYSIGADLSSTPSVSGSSYGLSVSGNVSVVKDTLEIYNRSSSNSNLFKILFDYQMSNFYGNITSGNYLKSTNESLAEFVFTSNKNANSFNINFDLLLGYEKKAVGFFNMWGYGNSINNRISQLRQIEIHK